jgi:hypothetical protein
MEQTATWHIESFLFEDGDGTRANAVLRTSAGTELRHEGIGRRNPKDTEVPELARNWPSHGHSVLWPTSSLRQPSATSNRTCTRRCISRHKTTSDRGGTRNERIVRHTPLPDRRRRALPMPPVGAAPPSSPWPAPAVAATRATADRKRSGASALAVMERDRQRKTPKERGRAVTVPARRERPMFADLMDWLETEFPALPIMRPFKGGQLVRVEDYVDEGQHVVRAELPGIDSETTSTSPSRTGFSRSRRSGVRRRRRAAGQSSGTAPSAAA